MPDRPHVVMIVADQWRWDCLGTLGRQPVMTPHLDQLADEGVHFTHCWADSPICMAQRITLLTGQVAARFGFPGNWMGGKGPAVDRRATLPALLRDRAGYQTRAIGKMHVEPPRARFGFDQVDLHPDDYVNWLEQTPWAGTYRGHGMGGNEVWPCPPAHPERFTHTHWIVDRALDFCGARDPEAPFFTQVIFEAPHSPFDPPEECLRLYDHVDVGDPATGDWDDRLPPPFRDNRLRHKFDRLSPDWIRQARRYYLAQCTHIDLQLGRLFGELNRRGWWQDSLVIFTADHGELLGDHGLFAKSCFLNASGRVPLLVKPPRGVDLGPARRDEPVMTADLVPTILAACGIDPATPVDGIDLMPMITGAVPDPRIICGECGGYAFATDSELKYCWYPQGGVEQVFAAGDHDDEHELSATRLDDAAPLKKALISWLEGFGRQKVQDGALLAHDDEGPDERALRKANPAACRGPMRYGMGY